MPQTAGRGACAFRGTAQDAGSTHGTLVKPWPLFPVHHVARQNHRFGACSPRLKPTRGIMCSTEHEAAGVVRSTEYRHRYSVPENQPHHLGVVQRKNVPVFVLLWTIAAPLPCNSHESSICGRGISLPKCDADHAHQYQNTVPDRFGSLAFICFTFP